MPPDTGSPTGEEGNGKPLLHVLLGIFSDRLILVRQDWLYRVQRVLVVHKR